MKRLLEKALHALLRDRYYDLVYWYLFFRRLPHSDDSRPVLVVLNHVFDQDIEALALANTAYRFVILPAAILRHVGTLHFPSSVESYSAYNNPSMTKLRHRYRAIIGRFAKKLHDQVKPVAVIAPSDNFFYVREFIPALHEHGIPYIVVDKEGTICPAYFSHFAEYIKESCPLIADHILVWSERQKRFWETTGVAANKITITGQPRSDFWKQPHRWLPRRELGIPGLRQKTPMVLFFTYDPWAYTPEYMVERGEMHWDQLRTETHSALFAYARQHPEVDLVIKAHPQQRDIAQLYTTIQQQRLPNVHLVPQPYNETRNLGVLLSNQLIVQADVIIGFQTTALIESMVTDTPIIYTFWGDARTRWSEDLIPFHTTKGIVIASDGRDLQQKIDSALQQDGLSPVMRQSRDAFVREYLTSVDGHASERTLRAITQFVSPPNA